MHLPCTVAMTNECRLVAGEGGFFVGRFAYRVGTKHWCLELAVGTEGGGGGVLARARAIPFKQVASWEVQEEEFFSEARPSMRGHIATFRSSVVGADVIDPHVVSDGEVTEGGRSDGGRSVGVRSDGGRTARSGGGKSKKRAAKDNIPPARKKIDGELCGQESCGSSTESGSRQPPA